jgi:azurin
MRGRQSADVDVVAHLGAVGGAEVGAVDLDKATLARGRPDRDLEDVASR